MAGSITDIVSAVQNSVVAMNSFAKQLTGSFNNISGQLSIIKSAYVVSIAGNSSAFTLNATTGITNVVNDIQLEQASSTQFGAVKVDGTSIAAAAGVISVAVIGQKFTNSLGGDVNLNNVANYFDGPSVAQGSSGVWFASGTVTLTDTGGAANMDCKLWDGTTVMASAQGLVTAAGNQTTVSLSGFIASPGGNIKISVNDPSRATGKIQFNATGNSKDSTISAIRIG